MKKALAVVAVPVVSFAQNALAAAPAQPDLTDVTSFLTAAIPTLSAVAVAGLALFISVKIYKWVRRAL